MIDRKTEQDMRAVTNFLEFWGGFHSIYNGMTAKGTISREDEAKFLETKSMIAEKYDELKRVLEFHYMPHGRLTDPVCDVLSVDSMQFVSEKKLKKLKADWKDAYVFLNNILERLKNKKRRLEQFNTVGVFFKKVFDRRE